MIPSKGETWKSAIHRSMFNFFPAYRRTSGRVRYIQSDYKVVTITVPLNWKTRNYVGTIYGGSLYGSVDPFYMLMLMQILPKSYIVWDKVATIKFKRPGNQRLYCTFTITDDDINTIKSLVAEKNEIDYNFTCYIKDKNGKVYAEVDKVIYVSSKEFYKAKQEKRKTK